LLFVEQDIPIVIANTIIAISFHFIRIFPLEKLDSTHELKSNELKF